MRSLSTFKTRLEVWKCRSESFDQVVLFRFYGDVTLAPSADVTVFSRIASICKHEIRCGDNRLDPITLPGVFFLVPVVYQEWFTSGSAFRIWPITAQDVRKRP
jgi:hypothetical protein